MTMENQREDLTQEPIDPPIEAVSDNASNDPTDPVSVTENEIPSPDEMNEEILDLPPENSKQENTDSENIEPMKSDSEHAESESPDPEKKQETEQTVPENETPTATASFVQRERKGGILLKPVHLLIAAVLIVALVSGSILFGMWLVRRDRDPAIEDNVKDYYDIYASAADIAAGNYAAPGYSEITFPAGKRDVQIILPNPQGNPCYFRYTLILRDTGEELYRSGLIEPGKAVTDIRLFRPLEAGDYVLELRIEAFSLEERAAMNGINMEVDLKVR